MNYLASNKLTGQRGFLLSNLLPHLVLDNCVIHFGSPSCREEFTPESTKQMVNDVKNLLKLNKPIVFASSVGVRIPGDEIQELYNEAKRQCEKLIVDSGVPYIILRIPRVYGAQRTKGLVQYTRDNKIDDWNKTLEYLDIDDFVKETAEFLNTQPFNNIKEYENLTINTIQEIKARYIKD